MKKRLQNQKSIDFHEFYFYTKAEGEGLAPPPPTAVKKDGFFACFGVLRSFAKYLNV
jgi:hypothetical protein